MSANVTKDEQSGIARSTVGTPRAGRSAVCCSGGGIRSASFNLGAIQALARSGTLENDVTLVTAVSGGSYIAASHALVAAQQPDLPIGEVYSSGSAEERHLRQHTRYLLPSAASALRGVLCIVFGLALNLSLLLGWIVLVVLPVGWLMHHWNVLDGLPPHVTFSPGGLGMRGLLWIVPAALLGLTLLLFAGSSSAVSTIHRRRFHSNRLTVCPPAQGCSDAHAEEGLRRWLSCGGAQDAMWWAFVAAAVTGYLLLAAPWLVAEVYHVGGSASGPTNHLGDLGSGLGSFFVALLAAVRLVIGGLRGDKASATGTKAAKGQPAADLSGVTRLAAGVPSKLWHQVQHVLTPWIGSAIAAAVLVATSLVAMNTAVRDGPDRRQVVAWGVVALYLLVARVAVDVNRTSLHSLYRDRLASAFAVRRAEPSGVAPAGQVRLSELARGDGSRPRIVVCATANITADGEVPAGRNGVSFTFTEADAGLEPPLCERRPRRESQALYRRVPMADYERVVGPHHLSLLDVVAISGAAVSPVMGNSTRTAERFLLALANVRLGVWLPHPALMPVWSETAQEFVQPRLGRRAVDVRNAPTQPALGTQPVCPVPADAVESRMRRALFSRRGRRLAQVLMKRLNLAAEIEKGSIGLGRRLWNELRWRTAQPNLRLLLVEAIGRTSLQNCWLNVTDGGHYENLGLVEALRRKPDEVFVFDASGDRTGSWATMGEAVGMARAELEVDIDIEPSQMVQDGKVVTPFVRGSFRYPGEQPDQAHDLWLVKLGVSQQAPWDVRAFALSHPNFPTDSTLKQLYDGREFEAYRALGDDSTTKMLAARKERVGEHVRPAVLAWSRTRPQRTPASTVTT